MIDNQYFIKINKIGISLATREILNIINAHELKLYV